MVRLDRVLVSSHKLPIVTMSLSAAVWPQSATHLFRTGNRRLCFTESHERSKELSLHFGRRQLNV